MKKILLAICFIVLGSIMMRAFDSGLFYSNLSIGTVVSTPAQAALTCYIIDDFQVVDTNVSRADILATFVRGNKLCFLRLPGNTYPTEWAPHPLPIDTPMPEGPNLGVRCPGYPNAPSPGMRCWADGGWR